MVKARYNQRIKLLINRALSYWVMLYLINKLVMDSKIGVLFDLDGVLVDTESKYSIFWEMIGTEYGVAIPDFAKVIKGSNLSSILNNYFPNKSDHKIIIDKLNCFQKAMTYELFEGVEEFLIELNQKNIPCCIVTSSDDAKMETLYTQLPNFKSYFKFVITGDMVTHSKPHPECYLTGAMKLGKEIQNCYVFEDSLQGLEAGRKSGAKVIALPTTNARNLLLKNSDYIIDGFKDFSVAKMLSL